TYTSYSTTPAPPHGTTLFPYTTLFRSSLAKGDKWKDPECVRCHVTGYHQPGGFDDPEKSPHMTNVQCEICHGMGGGHPEGASLRSEEHTSELQSRSDLVCRLLLEKKKQ